MSRFTRVRGAVLAAALGLTVASSAVLAQDAEIAPYEPSVDLGELGGSVVADGSSTVGPITEAVAEEFRLEGADGVQVTVDISGTGGGFERFCQGETDVQNASRAIREEEAATCAENGVAWYEFEVAYDGITVVANPANEFLTCMNVESLNLLWGPESTVDSWDDLNPEFPAEGIALYGPGTDSGTFDYFTDQINGEEGAIRETGWTPSEDDNVLVEGVAGDENALGYFGYAYYAANQDRLKAIAVDGGNGCVEPSPETIRDGSYAPLSRPLYVYVKADSLTRPEVQEFVRFYLANATELVDDVGYVASPTEIYVEDQAKVEAAIAGTGTPDSAAAAEGAEGAEGAATPEA